MDTKSINRTTIRDIVKEDEASVAKQGYGSVYFNKARNCYQAAFYTMESGEKKRKILSAPTYEDAMLTLAQLRAGQVAFVNENDIPTPKVYHKISDIWHYILYKVKVDIKDETRRWYSELGEIITSALGDKYIEELTSQDVQEFVNSLKYTKRGELASESRIKKVSEQLKAIITYSIDEGYITKNPYNKSVKRPKGIKRDPRKTAYTKDEVEKLLKHIKHSESIVIRTLIPCLLLSGVRVGEFFALGYSDLNRGDGTIRIRHSVEKKNGVRQEGSVKTDASNRVIPVPPIFFDIIDNWRTFVYKNPKRVERIKAKGTENIIFTGDKGEIRNIDTTRAKVSKMLKGIGLKREKTTFHAFRRTYATLMSWSGTDVETIAKLLGHKPEIDDGCEVARNHYINENEEDIAENKRLAVARYMEYMGDIFEKNIHFTHLRKGGKR